MRLTAFSALVLLSADPGSYAISHVAVQHWASMPLGECRLSPRDSTTHAEAQRFPSPGSLRPVPGSVGDRRAGEVLHGGHGLSRGQDRPGEGVKALARARPEVCATQVGTLQVRPGEVGVQ